MSKFVSIIGCETNYGSFLGTYNPLNIFTRAFEPKILLAKRTNSIIHKNIILIQKNQSSWSGVLGLGVIHPSSYISYGVDYDNDGIVDMYNKRMELQVLQTI